MPTYEYKCDACGHAFEKFQSIKADAVRKCPVCGKLKVRRLISTGAGLIFKGSGFYITDYRDASYKDSAKADSGNAPEPSKTEAKSEPTAGKSDAAPVAAKSESAPTATDKPAAEAPKASKSNKGD